MLGKEVLALQELVAQQFPETLPVLVMTAAVQATMHRSLPVVVVEVLAQPEKLVYLTSVAVMVVTGMSQTSQEQQDAMEQAAEESVTEAFVQAVPEEPVAVEMVATEAIPVQLEKRTLALAAVAIPV